MSGTILIVNISPAFGKILTHFFKDQGFEVKVAGDAIEAFRLFIMNPIDLILTDYHMPEISGGDLVRTFRSNKEHRDLPIVVFTGSLTDDLKEECEKAGASLVLDKSLNKDELVKAIKKLAEDYKEAHSKTGLDLDLANSTVSATKEVLKTMMNMDVDADEVDFQKVQPHQAEVIGSVGVAGFLSGSITIFMDRKMARLLTARMLMMEPEEIDGDDELVDAIGEVTNMIAGNIKTHLFKKIPLFDISTPSVTIGQGVRRTSVASQLCFLVPFRYEGYEMLVEFLLVSKDKDDKQGVSVNILTKSAS